MSKPPRPPLSPVERRVTLLYIAFLAVALAAMIVAAFLLYTYTQSQMNAFPPPPTSVKPGGLIVR